jgi:hypothetical protein
LNVREKILVLIDSWQEAFGGARGRFPQYYAAYNELRSFGVEFPPREENQNTVSLFTPPQTQPLVHPPSTYEDAAIQASLESADPSSLSDTEIQSAQGLSDILMEMLGALDPKNPNGVKDEVIVDLVDQCRSYQTRVMLLVNNTVDEELLCKVLGLNDNLQHVLRRHDDIVKGSPNITPAVSQTPLVPVVNINHEDDEPEDDFSQLAHRSRDNSQMQGRKPVNFMNEPVRNSSFIPFPPATKKPVYADSSTVDYLSGDVYTNEKSPETTTANSNPPRVSRPDDGFVNPTATPGFMGQPSYDEPSSKATDQIPAAPWDTPNSTVSLPPPPSRYNQRQQFFEQHHGFPSNASPHSSSGSGSSYDSLVGQTQSLGINSPVPNKQVKQEDALFKDLVDFAKAKSSSSSSKSNNRSF